MSGIERQNIKRKPGTDVLEIESIINGSRNINISTKMMMIPMLHFPLKLCWKEPGPRASDNTTMPTMIHVIKIPDHWRHKRD